MYLEDAKKKLESIFEYYWTKNIKKVDFFCVSNIIVLPPNFIPDFVTCDIIFAWKILGSDNFSQRDQQF